MSGESDSSTKITKQKEAEDRAARLAKALRDNLRRRKTQTKAQALKSNDTELDRKS